MKKLLLLPMALLLVLICGQAYPPASSGGAQADPLTLGGGIVSADGGVFTGLTKFQGGYPADGGAVEIQGGLFLRGDGGYRPLTVGERFTGDNINILLNGSTGITGISWDGVGTMQYTNSAGWSLNDSFVATKFKTNAASGSTAFEAATSGARWYFGGATDYFFNNGTQLELSGAGLRIPSGESLTVLGTEILNQNGLFRSSGAAFVFQAAEQAAGTHRFHTVNAMTPQPLLNVNNGSVGNSQKVFEVGAYGQMTLCAVGIDGGAGCPAAGKPTCALAARGMHWMQQGAAGVADTREVCQKDAADNYAWTAY